MKKIIVRKDMALTYQLDKEDDKKLLHGLILLTHLHGGRIEGMERAGAMIGTVFNSPYFRMVANQYPLNISTKTISCDSDRNLDYQNIREKIETSPKETLLVGRSNTGQLMSSFYIGRQFDIDPYFREIQVKKYITLDRLVQDK